MKRTVCVRVAIAVCLLLTAGCAAASVSSDRVDEMPVGHGSPQPAIVADAKSTDADADTEKADNTVIRYFVDDAGLAIRGTDPVAYFAEGAAISGRPEFAYSWRNATWQFASAENRDLFAANPEQYAPQYGGFCAWAVSEGYTASIDPEAWRIVDGRLYLNYSQGVQRQWEQDIPGNISRADENWPGVLSES
ncbi:MAG: YHS domain-containing (seleno)protein [Cyanobacteria bacterium J06614_10]